MARQKQAADQFRVAQLLGRPVPYRLRRRRRMRHLVMRVDGEGLRVSAPYGVSSAWIEATLQEKARWILKRLETLAARVMWRPDWRAGARLPYLGISLILAVEAQARLWPVERVADRLLVSDPRCHDPAVMETLVMDWYREEALRHLANRVSALAPALGLAPPPFALSSSRSEWGSCSSRGRLLFNWRLIQLPPSLVDYVVVHELAHLIELNHSPAFWRLVEQVYPGWRDARRALRQYG
ncbi:M48 family metallopeptidase [Pelomicrobium sp.]|jgi:predicted metal-dependent hydrolase|uniref:M48 family metallopeptidase n=1 Tax=Pelomicrobium sp. TaxID=2815319 RepID=UPI002FDE6752